LLQDLIKYGGRPEADKVTIERKARIPRHPVYIGTFIKYYKISQLIHTQSIAN